MNIAEVQKRQAAEAALAYVKDGMVVGVGTGSTIGYFIDGLARLQSRIEGAVSSSEQSSARLRTAGIPVLDLNAVGPIPLYVDGADECDGSRCLIKGGGGALTREKIIAEAAQTFICVIDASKRVDTLGRFPLPIEVIPMARSMVARQLVELGGQPVWRDEFTTDNGNWIIDLHGLSIREPEDLENRINQIPGVVSVGLFAKRRADQVIVGGTATITESAS